MAERPEQKKTTKNLCMFVSVAPGERITHCVIWQAMMILQVLQSVAILLNYTAELCSCVVFTAPITDTVTLRRAARNEFWKHSGSTNSLNTRKDLNSVIANFSQFLATVCQSACFPKCVNSGVPHCSVSSPVVFANKCEIRVCQFQIRNIISVFYLVVFLLFVQYSGLQIWRL